MSNYFHLFLPRSSFWFENAVHSVQLILHFHLPVMAPFLAQAILDSVFSGQFLHQPLRLLTHHKSYFSVSSNFQLDHQLKSDLRPSHFQDFRFPFVKSGLIHLIYLPRKWLANFSSNDFASIFSSHFIGCL
mgnify:CR=1 FL=1